MWVPAALVLSPAACVLSTPSDTRQKHFRRRTCHLCWHQQVPQGDWYCQRCHERGVAPPDAPKDSQLTWRTPGAHDYIRLSQMLGATGVQQPALEC